MNQQVTDNNVIDDEAGISLAQVIEFVTDQWQRLLLGAVVGLVLGVGGWAMLASYKAEAVLINNGAISFMSWRNLQKNLPLLAGQLLATKQVKPEEEAQYARMSSQTWWTKSVVPTYSLTKADTKDLASISKDMQEAGGSTILNLVVSANGSSNEAALANVDVATQFIKQGSAYLSIKAMLTGYESQVQNFDADLQKKILDAEVELKFLRERAHNLEVLRQRFPANAAVSSQQVVDLNDSNAKFMPISTQLVAVNTDINNTVQSLQRMRDQLAQMKVLRLFVEQAKPLVNKENNGLVLLDGMLKIEDALRQETSHEDTNALQMLNSLQASLVGTRTSFMKSLDTDLKPQVGRSAPLAPAAGGLLGGAILMLLVGLGQRFWAVYKSKGA